MLSIKRERFIAFAMAPSPSEKTAALGEGNTTGNARIWFFLAPGQTIIAYTESPNHIAEILAIMTAYSIPMNHHPSYTGAAV